jgi:hypothetical protein
MSRYLKQKDFTISVLCLFARRHKYRRGIQQAVSYSTELTLQIMKGPKNAMDTAHFWMRSHPYSVRLEQLQIR